MIMISPKIIPSTMRTRFITVDLSLRFILLDPAIKYIYYLIDFVWQYSYLILTIFNLDILEVWRKGFLEAVSFVHTDICHVWAFKLPIYNWSVTCSHSDLGCRERPWVPGMAGPVSVHKYEIYSVTHSLQLHWWAAAAGKSESSWEIRDTNKNKMDRKK